jgi:hypothetical protein
MFLPVIISRRTSYSSNELERIFYFISPFFSVLITAVIDLPHGSTSISNSWFVEMSCISGEFLKLQNTDHRSLQILPLEEVL